MTARCESLNPWRAASESLAALVADLTRRVAEGRPLSPENDPRPTLTLIEGGEGSGRVSGRR